MNRRFAFGLLAAVTALASLPATAADDPRPDPVLASVLGEWRGSLTYRDYSRPDKTETLPTRLFVSMIAPDELALHFVYDDGPGKTVYGYQRLRFEFPSQTLVWISGAVERTALIGRIVSSTADGGVNRYVVDTTKDQALSRYTFEFGPKSFTLKKDEIDSAGQATNRNRYSFTR
jgi:hypothetical protein